MKEMHEYIIDGDFDGARLDRFLRKTFSELPLSAIHKMIRKKEVRVNGRSAAGNTRLSAGDRISCPREEKEKTRMIPVKDVPLNVLYEDEDIIIVDKDQGMPVHRGSGHNTGLTELLRIKTGNQAVSPVHRIDRRTGGAVMFGKSRKALREMSEMLRSGKMEKRYFALVRGVPLNDEFYMEDNLLRTDKGMVSHDEGKPARAKVTLVAKNNGYSILEVLLETGRTHQIRTQLSLRGLPIVGDGRYGVFEEGPMYLYSHFLRIQEKNITVEAGLPEFFKKRLRNIP